MICRKCEKPGWPAAFACPSCLGDLRSLNPARDGKLLKEKWSNWGRCIRCGLYTNQPRVRCLNCSTMFPVPFTLSGPIADNGLSKSAEFTGYEIVSAMDDDACDACKAHSGLAVRPEDLARQPLPIAGCRNSICRCRIFANFRTGIYVIDNGKKRWIRQDPVPVRAVWEPPKREIKIRLLDLGAAKIAISSLLIRSARCLSR